jgi:acetoacetyl-CoA synthetase
VSDVLQVVPQLPRTLTGKRREVPVKHVLQGMPVEDAVALGSVTNPESLHDLARLQLALRDHS